MKLTDRKEATDWFSQSKYGVFFHYLYDIDDMPLFNAEKFAADVNETGAKYAFITLGQNSGYYCAPNPTYEELTKNAPGSKCYTGDIPTQAAKALEKYGIKLMVYLPSHPPSRDNDSSIQLGVNQKVPDDWLMNDTAVENWCKVVRAWSEHFGKTIHGWWFDGFYPWIALDEHYAESYKKAVLAGNDETILALNQGVEPTVYPANKYCDYTAGEFNEFTAVPESRFVDGAQWHVLSFLGNTWTDASVKYDGEYMSNYIATVNSKGGVVTVDMHIEKDGSLVKEQLDVMRVVKQRIRG